ncbi:MAG: SDR family NAD(P)-dependent oxidoreductase [Rhizobiaceae bacterium]
MDLELKDKVALVTGGSRGIGRATALMLAEHGTDVAIRGRSIDSLEDTAAAIRKLGVQCWFYQTDVSQPNEIEQLINCLGEDAKRIDILVNNAVTSTSATFEQLTDEQFQYHIDVKLMAYIRIARLVLPFMKAQGGGRIVNVGGMTARIVAPLRMTNGVVNAGVANFTKQFSGYAASSNVTVNCVHPGYTLTERVMQVFEREAKEIGASVDEVVAQRTGDIPLGKLIDPDDLASAIVFFCSPMARMVTGQCIAVDGGSGTSIPY